MRNNLLLFSAIIFAMVLSSCENGDKHNQTVTEDLNSGTLINSVSETNEESFYEQNESEQDSDHSSENSESTTSSYIDLPWI